MSSIGFLPIGELKKTGSPVNGRQNYEVSSQVDNVKHKISVPVQEADKFEKLHQETQECYNSIASDESQARLQEQGFSVGKKMKWGTPIGAAIGGLIPAITAIMVKGSVVKRSILGVIGSLAGAAVGAFAGMYIPMKVGMGKILKHEPTYQKMQKITKQVQAMDVQDTQEPLA